MTNGAPERVVVDLGGTKLAAARVCGGSVITRREVMTPARHGPHAVASAIGKILDGMLLPDDTHIGIAATGAVTAGNVRAVNRATMPGWDDVPLAKLVEDQTHRAVLLLNDAHAAAYGEWHYGRGRGAASPFLFVTISTGVGAGVVIDGKVLQGAHGLATHVGFLPSGLQGTALELHASGGALGRQASQQLGREVDARTVVLLAEEGDEVMLDLIQAAVRELAVMLRSVQWVLDPECIAIGGGVGLAPLVFDALERAASRDEALGVRAPMHLVRAELGANAGLIGMGAWLDEHANP